MLKVFLKISVMLFLLLMVVLASRYFSSDDFKSSINDLFNVPGRPFQWCKIESAKFKWLDPQITPKYNTWTEAQLANKYCLLQMEKIDNVDIKKAQWVPLASSVDSDGRPSELQWDAKLKIFRVAGLPFKSSFLYFDLMK